MKYCLILIVAGCLLCTKVIVSQGIIIDHTFTQLSQIPLEWIDSVQLNQKWHYGHTSHGGQLTTGLERIELDDTTYSVALTYSSLPVEPEALCVFEGQENSLYATPDQFWKTHEGMNNTRNVLNNNPTINVSQWSWCTQPNYWTSELIQTYLDSMSVLEAEFPDVKFIYMTANAQTGPGNHYNQNLDAGYNRYLRNEQIRNYCISNNKNLYDFADID
ncbi:MAG: hypothetical protein K8S16_21185, partial [Bacteroidales bacterium]|nr:hypothetical protein [Bacteroidales bacterium]